MSITGTPGTGDVSLNVATSGYQTLANGGVANGDTFSYVIEDGANWEVGLGTYHSSGPSFSRTTVYASSGGGTSKISASSSAIVFSAILGEDVVPGVSTLAALTDATITSPANNDVLTYITADGKWENKPASGGGGGGTPPTMVQFGSVSANSTIPSITLGGVPANGNLLVAILMTDGSDPTTASGWTLQSTFSSGTWFFHIYTKVCGGSESTSQFPVTGGSSSNWACGIWEVHGQSVTPVVTSGASGVSSNTFLQTPVLPVLTSSICFFALVSTTVSNALAQPFGAQTTDVNLSAGTGGRPVFGHSNSTASVYGMCATQASAAAYDAGLILVTA